MQDDTFHPDATAKLPWLSGRPVAVDFNGPTALSFDPLLPEHAGQPAIRRFHAMVDRFAGKIAIDDGTTRMSYGQVSNAVNCLAGAIRAATPPGAPIAAILDNTAAFPVVFLACLMTGRPIIPIDTGYPAERQQAILQECGAAAIILGAGLTLPAGAPKSLPMLDASLLLSIALADQPNTPEPPIETSIDAPAGVIYTSGSTGQPKGVAFSQRQFLASLAEYVNACHIGPDDRLLGLASLSGASVREAMAALLTGATFHISDLRQSGIAAAIRTFVTARITVLAFVPSVMRSFTAIPDAAAALGSLRILDLFGEQVTAEAVTALRSILPPSCHIRVSLGSTETMILFHWFVPPGFVPTGAGLPCGYLASNMSIAVLDDAGAPVEPNTAGEVVVRSRFIASGMWRDGAVLAGPFQQDMDDPACRIFHTGDLIRLRADGLAEFVGRSDRRVKIRGLRADPNDVEAALHRITGIADCAVVTRTSGNDTTFLAYVVANGLTSSRPIRNALRDELPPHMLPAEVHLIASIPRLPNFKPDLVALARVAATVAPSHVDTIVAPSHVDANP